MQQRCDMRMVLINNIAEHLPAWQQPVHCTSHWGKKGKTNTPLVMSQVDKHILQVSVTLLETCNP